MNDMKHIRRLEQLRKKLAMTEEKERQRIAKDLHDGVCQLLVGSKIEMSFFRDTLVADEHKEKFNSFLDTVAKAADQARIAMCDMFPPTLQRLGLEAAIEEHLSEISTKFGLETSYKQKGDLPVSDSLWQGTLFRMVRELLINTVKHAQANWVGIDIKFDSGTLDLAVSDDGIGFSPDRSIKGGEDSSGLGLLNIKEQAERLGGKMEIETQPGKGTKIQITVPVPVTPLAEDA
jgi:two-component system sensor histidine kinase DegS